MYQEFPTAALKFPHRTELVPSCFTVESNAILPHLFFVQAAGTVSESALFFTVAIIPVVLTVVYPTDPLVPCAMLHPDGAVIEMPPESIVSAAVKVKVKVFPVVLTFVLVGVTVFVPEPSAA